MNEDKENLIPQIGWSSIDSTKSYLRTSQPLSNTDFLGSHNNHKLQMSLELHPHRIVRFGENENDIFMLRHDDTVRSQLVEKLKQDPSSSDRWLELLKCAPSYDAKLFSKLRLFRRATTILSKEKFRQVPSYVELWILFAKTKESEKETRETFKYMKSERIGETLRFFYEEYARFESTCGHLKEAEEILVLGVKAGALTLREKEEIYTSLDTRGKSTSDDKPLARVPIEPSTTITTNGWTPTTPKSLTTTSSGFSTARKAPRVVDPQSLGMVTPSMPPRPITAQTTSGKASFLKLGGPLRVIASTRFNSTTKRDLSLPLEEEEDEDDNGMDVDEEEEGEGEEELKDCTPREPSPIAPKPSSFDLSYIKNWTPRPTVATNADTKATTTTKASPVAAARPYVPSQPPLSHPVSTSSSFARPDDNHILYRSPKRQHLAPSSSAGNHVPAVLSSPISISSVSSTSSPPTSNTILAIPRDPFSSLTTKVTVNGLTYIKLEQIGSGGSSKVYRMLGPDLKIYALKKIKLKKLDAKSIAQYTNEIELLQRLQGNPYIIKLIAAESDLSHRTIHVIMEHGEIDLSERLRELGGTNSLDENLLRVLWTQMLQAVHAIHRERIIHGDLKPANFLFVSGTLKLIDFGIAKAISNDTTNIERDSQVGTVNFMSPEAIQGNNGGTRMYGGNGATMKVGRASDIWSLGCILYQIVYGKPPFGDVHSILEKFRCIVDPNVAISFPSLKNKELEDVIQLCLQRDHKLRPPIDGTNGLLQHAFLRASTTSMKITLSNAHDVLDQMTVLLQRQGVETSQIQTFRTIGEKGFKHSSTNTNQLFGSDKVYKYDTEERQTEI